MEITVSQAQARVTVTILQPSGEIDSSNYQEFSDATREAIEGGSAQHVLLDLGEVTYISSAGLRAINEIFLMFRKKYPNEVSNTQEKSHRLKLLSPQERVREVLSISGVDSFLESYNNLQDALASY